MSTFISRGRLAGSLFTTLASVGLALSAPGCVEPEPDADVELSAASDELSLPPSAAPAEVRAGTAHTCVRRQNGKLTCWGRTLQGEAGDGLVPASPYANTKPQTEVAAAAPIGSGSWLAAGGHRACLRTAAKAVKCWGYSGGGWPGGAGASSTPTTVPGLVGVDEIVLSELDVDYGHPETACARSGGTVKCWGGNDGGQLGTGAPDYLAHPVPTTIPGLGNEVAQIALGQHHACARFTDGRVTCWGKNGHGQLGNGTTTPAYSVGAPIAGLTDVVQLALGEAHTCALRSNGLVKCWGAGGRIGDGTTTDRLTPRSVTQFVAAAEISAGQNHTCARMVDGTVSCWGQNWKGQLGIGSDEVKTIPYSNGLTGVKQITVGADHSCALTVTGEVQCWGGYNQWGEIGNGSQNEQWSPTPVIGL